MNEIENWINNNYDILKRKTSRIQNDEADDIFQEVLIQFLEMDTGKTCDLINKNEADKYFMAMFKVNCFSATSPYQRKYNLLKMNSLIEYEYNRINDPTYQICWTDFEDMLNDMDIFFIDKIVFKEYIEKKMDTPSYSINKMSMDSTIPKGTLDSKFKYIRKELKNTIKKRIINDEKNRDD